MRKACYGAHRAVIRSERVLLSETTHSAELRTPSHAHPFFCLHFVLQGLYEESTKGHTHRLEPGELLFKPAGEVHWNRFRQVGAVTFRLELDGAASPALADALPSRPETLRAPHLANLARKAHAELACGDDLSTLIAESVAMELLGAVARLDPPAGEHGPSLARECATLLDARFQEPYRLGLAAEELGVDRTALARAFRAELGCSVGEYIRQRRVELVADRLRNGTRRGLSELAAEAGFSDQSHLTRVFKQVLGMPPGAWRRRYG